MKSKNPFTLIEVIIASFLLAIVLAITAEMAVSTQNRVFDAESKWAKQHLLNIGCEYFLLMGPDADPPNDMLPEGYSLTCELRESETLSEMSEEYTEPERGWILAEYVITLFQNGEELDSIVIEKLVREDQL